MVKNISLLEELWNWIHLHWVNGSFFLPVAENHRLFSLHQTVIENLLNVSNDTIGYHLQEFYRGCGVCCSNWLSCEPAVRGRVGAVSSFSTRGSAPAFILPSLTLPGLLWLDSRGIRDRLFCPTQDSSNALSLLRDSQPAWLRLFFPKQHCSLTLLLPSALSFVLFFPKGQICIMVWRLSPLMLVASSFKFFMGISPKKSPAWLIFSCVCFLEESSWYKFQV